MKKPLLIFVLAIAAVAAGFYFRPEPTAPAREQSASLTPKQLPPAPAQPEPAAPVIKPPDPAKTLEDLSALLPGMTAPDRDKAINDFVQQLRQRGPDGLNEVATFLRSGRDVKLRDGYRMDGDRMTEAPTMRMALLESLRDWEGSTAVLLDFLKTPASILELTFVARGLELQYPGSYRGAVISALQARLSDKDLPELSDEDAASLFATARHFQATELLSALERISVQNAPDYVQWISTLPEEARGPAMKSFLTQPELADKIAEAPQTLNYWSFADSDARAFVAEVFAKKLNVDQRLAMLNHLDPVGPTPNSSERAFTTAQNQRDLDRAASTAATREIQSRKELLKQLATLPDQSEDVQGAIHEAQRRITDELAFQGGVRRAEQNPAREVPIGNGEGKATIKGRRVERFQVPPAGVNPPDENSTNEPSR